MPLPSPHPLPPLPSFQVLSECAAYGSVKERKKMLKALKGYVAPTLFHKDAYLFILRLADVVDDSVAFNKTVWTELLANNADDAALLQFATHAKAYKVLVHLLAPQKKATFLNKVSPVYRPWGYTSMLLSFP